MSNQFHFKYTAPSQEERKEIDSIRRQYAPKEQAETKLQRLRRLDALVKNTSVISSLCLGIVGTLIFGLGLTMVLQWALVFWGVVLMIVGSVPMALAYPVYRWVLGKCKDRYGEEIIRLSDELLNEIEEETK